MTRLILGLIAAEAVAWGQLTFSRPVDDTPVSATLDVGSAAPDDALDTPLRLRNTGTVAVVLSVLRIRGTGFTLEGNPALPFTMVPGANVDFRVRFRPTGAGNYSATLEANNTSLLVRGSSSAGLVLLRDGVPAANDVTIDLGAVYLGQRGKIAFVLRNDSKQDIPVRQFSVTGAGFSLAPTPLPTLLHGGEEVPFELRFDPQRTGVVTGSLQLDTRAFKVTAFGRQTEAPDAWIELDPQAARSGKQSSLRIRLAAPATMTVTGSLRLEFTPSVSAGAGDAAIQFLANSSRSVTVQVDPGDAVATVSGKSDVSFQTGTTAGTAVFRLALGSQEREAAVILPPEAPMVDSVEMRPSQGSVEVAVTGFDNYRSAGNIVFTFTDQAGQELPAISAEAGAAFAEHFRTSTMGGLFRLTARFPVTGEASKLARVAVRLANGIGAGTGRSE